MIIIENPDKPLWDILQQDYGFTPKTINTTGFYNRIKHLLGLKYVARTVESDDWLVATINGNKYDVMALDLWYTSVHKNGRKIFDKRRFDNIELLNLLN